MTNKFDNNLIGVARRYAKALIEVAMQKNEIDAAAQDLQTFNEMYSSSDDLKNVLTVPTIKVGEKKLVLAELTSMFKSNTVKDFLYLLADEGRFNTFQSVYYAFQQELDAQKGLVQVEVKSVIDLDDTEKQRLKDKLEGKLNKSVNINYVTTPEIIGGLVISFEGKTIDLSVGSKFEGLKKQLK